MQILTVLNVFSRILAVFALMMMIFPITVGLYYDNPIDPFLKSGGMAFSVAAILWITTRGFIRELRTRDGLLLATMAWVLLPLFGALPLVFHIEALSFTDGYFEAVSGLTTTGATVLTKLDSLPEAINFWRAFLIWVGGMGIIVLSVAILPLLGVGGSQIIRAEAPGPMKDNKLTPRITETAKGLWFVYFAMTLLCGLSFYWAGMSGFDAIVHACTTMGLGGFSSHDSSFAHWNSQLIESIAVFFMLIAGINYATHFQALRSRTFSPYRWDPETRWFLGIVLGVALVFALYLWQVGTYSDFMTALRYTLFNVVSVATTTGYANIDYATAWPLFMPITMLLLAAFTTCSGSTGSGLKMIRVVVLFKQLKNELIRVVHPGAHVSVKLSGRVVATRVVFSILTFFFVYVLCSLLITMVLCTSGLDEMTALSATLACFNNTGPGLNEIGPSSTYEQLNDFQIWLLSLAMLLGRLEIFTFLAVLTPAFWRR